MVDEIARLGVAVDSTPAVSASRDLDQLAASGDRATQSARSLSQSWQGAQFSSGKILTVRKSVRDFAQSLQQAKTEADKLDSSWKANTFSDRQLYSVNRALNRYKQELKESRAAVNEVTQAQGLMAASGHQVSKAAAGYTKSAKEIAFANRNLPAQFTDIAVSLQAGQAPLTVLLQQGGQIKDMYGGVTPALQAMGRYVVGLINPYTLLAAAVGALAIAWIQGDAEARKINRALVLQGNTLGVTTDQLHDTSAAMARFGQTQRASAAALTETASSGKIFKDSIETVAQTAINLQRTAGQAISETVEDFASLAEKPLEAALELDEQYRFLTISVYDQIRALEQQGDTMGATRVATDALANTLNERTSEVDENLGTLEKTWRAVANSAKWAWDQMLNIGRADSISTQINELNAKILEIENPSNMFSYSQLGRAGSQARKDRAEELKKELRELHAIQIRDYEEAEQKYVQDQARVASLTLAEQARQGETNAQKRIYERAQIESRITTAIAGIVASSEEDRVRQETRIREDGAKAIAAMEERLRDPKEAADPTTRTGNEQAREYERLDRALMQHTETLRAAGESRSRLSSFERWAIRTLSDLDTEYSNLDATQKEEIKNRIESLRVLDQENTERERQARALGLVEDLTRSLADTEAAQRASMASEMRSLGMGREQAALANTMDQISIRSQQERIRLAERMGDLNSENSQEYLDGLRQINEAEQRQLDTELNHWHQRRAAMMDWRNGARAAMDEIEMASWDVAGQTKDAYLTAFSAMNNALGKFAETGKLKIRDFATVVIAELTRIALTIALSKALTSMFGQWGGQTNFDSSASINIGSAYSGGGQVGTAERGAVVAAGRLVAMSKGGVRTSPTLMPLANGDRLLMAEQAPEAVMPLARGPDGKLGVRAGGGGGTTFNVNTHVFINNDGTASSSTSVDSSADDATARDGRRIAQALEEKVREVLVAEQRHGGILWTMKNRG